MIGQISNAASGDVTRDVGGGGGTGRVCPNSGPYKCSSHANVIVSFQRGQTFPACPVATDTSRTAEGHSTTWAMVREVDAVAFEQTYLDQNSK